MPEEPSLHIVGVLGAGPHQESGDFTMLAGLSDGSTAVIRIKLDILSGLSLLIRQHLSKATYRDDGGTVYGSPMELRSCQPFSVADGKTVGMMMDIEHMKLPVAFRVEEIPTVVSALNRMLELSRTQPAPTSVN
ncbi:MAG TPA: hypothetical protein VHX61_07695 [Rhizomicrobium sp.]|jgi:hypothetical protein|nr:hypothetical protein [Rhizomicrobium sp.]